MLSQSQFSHYDVVLFNDEGRTGLVRHESEKSEAV